MNKTLAVVPMYQGNTKRIHISVVDTSNTPVSLLGATSVFTLVSKRTGATILTKTQIAGITYSGNILSVLLAPADTASVAIGDYDAKTVVTLSSGDVGTVSHFLLRIE
jgi:hypothetical protein